MSIEYFQNEIRGHDLHQTDIYLPATIIVKEDYYKVDGLRIYFSNPGKKLFGWMAVHTRHLFFI